MSDKCVRINLQQSFTIEMWTQDKIMLKGVMWSEVTVEYLALLLYNWKVPGSISGQEAGYPDWDFGDFSQSKKLLE
jgi:hypothetical protein